MESERNIFDHISVLARWRRMIFVCCFAVTLVTAGISLILPKSYRAYATVYPPQETAGGIGGLSALLQELPINLMGLGGEAISAMEFVPVVESESVRLTVAERFDLAAHYGANHQSELLDMIARRLTTTLSREQFLTISYEADTPERAAMLTNAFVEELENALQQREQQQTRAYLAYLTNRLEEAERDMLDAERRYRDFQNAHMVLDVDAQATTQLEIAAALISPLAELIVKRDVQARMMTADNPKLKALDLEIQTTRQVLDDLLMGQFPDTLNTAEPPAQLPPVFKPFRHLPDLGLAALQHLRDIQIQNAIYQFVKQEYEKTRFENEKGGHPVVVLDHARPPDTRSYPRRTLMVGLAAGLSLTLSCVLAFVFEAMRNMTPDNRAKLEAIGRGDGRSETGEGKSERREVRREK